MFEICLQRLNHAYLYRSIGAICVQRFDDSLNPAVRITYRISRRSSSYSEPRDPSLSDVVCFNCCNYSLVCRSLENKGIVLVKNKVLRPNLDKHGECSREPKWNEEQPDRDTSVISSETGYRLLHKSKIHVTYSEILSMILPQVHLQKPCYDFSFL